jgi:hypothetical protein
MATVGEKKVVMDGWAHLANSGCGNLLTIP